MSKILIIGNGFDLNLGLKTSYSDFVNSDQFNELLTNNNLARNLHHIHSNQNWVDIEHELKKYTSELEAYLNSDQRVFDHNENKIHETDLIKKILNSLKQEFVALKKALTQYLKSQLIPTRNLSEYDQTSACELAILGYLTDSPKISKNPFTEIFTFNYTNALKLINFEQHIENCQIHYIHGALASNDIVFGVEDGVISPEHSYLNKSDHAAFGNAPDVSTAIAQSKEVHFFGCSLGDTDNAHFERAFKEISTNSPSNLKDEDKRKIHFYTFGRSGYRSIYNRIMTLTEGRISEFKLINKVTFYDLADKKEIDQEWLNQ